MHDGAIAGRSGHAVVGKHHACCALLLRVLQLLHKHVLEASR